MANPNIVNVTTIHGESIGAVLTADMDRDIMTVVIHKLLKINYISVCNTSTSVAKAVTVIMSKTNFESAGVGASDDEAGDIYLAATMNVPANDTLVIIDTPVYLMAGDTLKAGSTPAGGLMFISFEVLDDAVI